MSADAMTTRPHIGIAGAARTGKDTAAAWFTAHGWERASFADPLRAMALDVDPYVEVPSLEGVSFLRLSYVVSNLGWEHAKEYPDVRRFLQRLGTDGVRNHLGVDTWVTTAMSALTGPGVFSDVRFPNEADAIRSAGGIVIRLVRTEAAPVGEHESESALNGYDFDAIVLNDGSVADLHRRMGATVVRTP